MDADELLARQLQARNPAIVLEAILMDTTISNSCPANHLTLGLRGSVV